MRNILFSSSHHSRKYVVPGSISLRELRCLFLSVYPTTVVWGLPTYFPLFFPQKIRTKLLVLIISHWVPSMVSFSYLTYCSCICQWREGNPSLYIRFGGKPTPGTGVADKEGLPVGAAARLVEAQHWSC